MAAVLCAVVAVALTGCVSRPAGVDGDLINGWPALAAAKTPVPQVGACYEEEYAATWYGAFVPVSCDESHRTETTYVGTFTGADARRTAPPNAGTPGRAAAYRACVAKTADYLGGDWHAAYVWLGLVLPSTAAWSGGARWYRCDLARTNTLEREMVPTSGSAKDGLRGRRPLAITCINTIESKSGDVQSETAMDCASSHTGEFVGAVSAPDTPWPGDKGVENQADKTCDAAVAKYLGLAGVHDTNPWVGWLYNWPTQSAWEMGDRTFMCFAYAYTASKKMVGSVKGLRGRAPKS